MYFTSLLYFTTHVVVSRQSIVINPHGQFAFSRLITYSTRPLLMHIIIIYHVVTLCQQKNNFKFMIFTNPHVQSINCVKERLFLSSYFFLCFACMEFNKVRMHAPRSCKMSSKSSGSQYEYHIGGVPVKFPFKPYPTQMAMMAKVRTRKSWANWFNNNNDLI